MGNLGKQNRQTIIYNKIIIMMYYISILLLLLYILIKSSYLSYLIVVKTNTVLIFDWVATTFYTYTKQLPTYP